MAPEDATVCSMPGLVEPLQLSTTVSHNGSYSSDWYTPTTVSCPQLPFSSAYMTPNLTIVSDDTPYIPYVTAQDASPVEGYPPYDFTTVPQRPRSSPSTFGPSVEDLVWQSNPLRIKHDSADDLAPYPTAPYSPIIVRPPPLTAYYPTFGHVAQLSTPQPRKPSYTPIAPNPVGLKRMNSLKRPAEDDDLSGPTKKRKSSMTGSGPLELNEEDKLLLKLKEDESLPWKDIAARFHSDLGRSYHVPALQMRYKRLRERQRTWTDSDINALRLAHDYYEKYKFEIISAKMAEFGCSEKWPAKYCARKWSELNPGSDVYPSATGSVTAFSQPATPIDGPAHMPFFHMP